MHATKSQLTSCLAVKLAFSVFRVLMFMFFTRFNYSGQVNSSGNVSIVTNFVNFVDTWD